jgi:hypothetical protein
VSAIEKRLADKQYNPLQPIPIAYDPPDDLYLYFSERAADYLSVAVERQSVRTTTTRSPRRARLRRAHHPGRDRCQAGGSTNSKGIAKLYQPNSSIEERRREGV